MSADELKIERYLPEQPKESKPEPKRRTLPKPMFEEEEKEKIDYWWILFRIVAPVMIGAVFIGLCIQAYNIFVK